MMCATMPISSRGYYTALTYLFYISQSIKKYLSTISKHYLRGKLRMSLALQHSQVTFFISVKKENKLIKKE